MGRSFADSPGAIAAELSKLDPSIKIVWSVASKGRAQDRRNSTVVRGSIKYLWYLSVAKFLIDNQTLPPYFQKKKGQVYLQTWHGIPLKTMGYDEPSFRTATKNQRANLAKRVSYWDYLIVPSDYFERTFVRAYKFEGQQLRGGTPRNDALVDGSLTTATARARLGINTDRKVILYTPTFRTRGKAALGLDVIEWVQELGENTLLLVRSHYLNTIPIPKHLSGQVADMSHIDDVNLLYMASDLMITDYSSTMFDYSLLDRPILLYTYDYDSYVSSQRGTYFDLRENAPGEISYDMAGLVDSVRRHLDGDPFADQRRRFRNAYVGLEDGRTSERTINHVWKKL